jgi:DNA-binding beta-propeller fold protein YncE
MAFDSAGNLYVANQANNTVQRFTPGGAGSVFVNSGLSNPQGLAFDLTG